MEAKTDSERTRNTVRENNISDHATYYSINIDYIFFKSYRMTCL